MNKFYINGCNLIGDEGYGVQRYTTELLRELDRLVKPGQISIVFPNVGPVKYIEKNKFVNIQPVMVDIPHIKGGGRIWNLSGFVNYVKKVGGISIDLTLNMSYAGCDVVCIYDCIREFFPECAVTAKDKLARTVYIKTVKNNIKSSKVILTDSVCSKNDLIKTYNVKNKPIVVIPGAWQHIDRIEEDKTIMSRLNLAKGEYFFSLGSRSYHKNFRWIVEAARQNTEYKFVVSGTNVLSKSDNNLDNEKTDNLTFTGFLSDGEIKTLMKNCRFFIQPSLYEGFGMPPMEAMSVGARCIVSNTSSLPEVYGDSVWYIDPKEYENIDFERITSKSIAENENVLNKYSWKSGAKILYDVLNHYFGLE